MYPTSARRELRGAAKVALVWLVVVALVAVLGLAMWFGAQSRISEQTTELGGRDDQISVLKREKAALATELQQLSAVVGFHDDGGGSTTQIAQAQAGLDELRQAVPDAPASATSAQALLAAALGAIQTKTREADEAEKRATSLRDQAAAAEDTVRRVTADKDKQLAELQDKLDTEQQNAKTQKDNDAARVARLQQQLSDLDAAKRAVERQMDELTRAHAAELQTKQARLAELSRLTAFRSPPLADAPDGHVLAVSSALGSGWIDLGTKNRLAVGTRFRVVTGAGDAARTKGWAEVTRAEAATAEVRFSELVDRFDPVVVGDALVNPVYDPTGERNAVLVGRFSGLMDEANLRLLLKSMGITVQDEIDISTNYLIVGGEIWTDELGQPLEEPLDPKELPVYREAEALAVQIVPLQDLRSYFRFDLQPVASK
jgi:hypothetical protein